MNTPMQSDRPFMTIQNITIRVRDRGFFQNSSWHMGWDEHWAILGPNGSGKSTLVRALWGGTPLQRGSILYHFAGENGRPPTVPPREAIGYVSFETHQSLMEHEDLEQEFRVYAGKKDEATTAQDVMLSAVASTRPITTTDQQRLREVTALLGVTDLVERPITALSTGEMRKTLIARALLKEPKLLILDEPFEGLDQTARESLAESITRLMAGSLRVVLIVHRLEEILPRITHVLLVKDGVMFLQGNKESVLKSKNISHLFGCDLCVAKRDNRYSVSQGTTNPKTRDLRVSHARPDPDTGDTLIEMRNTTVSYGDVVVLKGITWSMKRGENWAILGPNGAGKSTLLRLVLGENLQGYANQLWLFGKRRGSGETLWEIKKHIGVVSSELQIQYRKRMNSFDVIASGFYDSMGLYQHPTHEQKELVRYWVELLHLEDITGKIFNQLSYGQKRMILLARAMVKSPILLVLDEPCHGLDIRNRHRLLTILERIGEKETSLLYVTNREDELLNCMTHVMVLRKGRSCRQGPKEEVLLEEPGRVSDHSS